VNKVADYLFYIEKPPADKWSPGIDCTKDIAVLAANEVISSVTTQVYDEDGVVVAGIKNGSPSIGTYENRTFALDANGRVVIQPIQAGSDQQRLLIIFTVNTSIGRTITYGYVVDVVAYEIGD
jgi:hypothetical protein